MAVLEGIQGVVLNLVLGGAGETSRRFLCNPSAGEKRGSVLTACAGGCSVPNSYLLESFGALWLQLAVIGDALRPWGSSSVPNALLLHLPLFLGSAVRAARCFKLGKLLKKDSEMINSDAVCFCAHGCPLFLFRTENVSRLLTSMWKTATHLGWSPTKVFLLFPSRVSGPCSIPSGLCFLFCSVFCDAHDKISLSWLFEACPVQGLFH